MYTHFELNHTALFALCSSIQGGFIMTYDNVDEVKELVKQHGFEAKPIPMKNTHHAAMSERVIGKHLGWMKGMDRTLEQPL